MPSNESPFLFYGMRALATLALTGVRVSSEGVERVPRDGPVLLVCRHYHHLYDGLVLLTALQRAVHIYVALDWVRDSRQRWCMETLCRFAHWPVVLRDPAGGHPWGGGFRTAERYAYLRSSLAHSVSELRAGRVLAIFPEGYPVVDPIRRAENCWPPFEGGYLGIALRAQATGVDVPLVPVGFVYEGAPDRPTGVTVRFGVPERIASSRRRDAVGKLIQAEVRALSGWEASGQAG